MCVGGGWCVNGLTTSCSTHELREVVVRERVEGGCVWVGGGWWGRALRRGATPSDCVTLALTSSSSFSLLLQPLPHDSDSSSSVSSSASSASSKASV